MPVAPEMLVHDPAVPVEELCHWYEMPKAKVEPVSVSENNVVELPVVGDMEAVPVVGAPEQVAVGLPQI